MTSLLLRGLAFLGAISFQILIRAMAFLVGVECMPGCPAPWTYLASGVVTSVVLLSILEKFSLW